MQYLSLAYYECNVTHARSFSATNRASSQCCLLPLFPCRLLARLFAQQSHNACSVVQRIHDFTGMCSPPHTITCLLLTDCFQGGIAWTVNPHPTQPQYAHSQSPHMLRSVSPSLGRHQDDRAHQNTESYYGVSLPRNDLGGSHAHAEQYAQRRENMFSVSRATSCAGLFLTVGAGCRESSSRRRRRVSTQQWKPAVVRTGRACVVCRCCC